MGEVLVLGAGGFIGRHLVARLLAEPCDVHLTLAGHGVNGIPSWHDLNRIEGDIDDDLLLHCTRPEVVFFLAGGSSVARSHDDPEDDHARGIFSLQALLHRLKGEWCGSRLIFISSAAVYGTNGTGKTGTNTIPAPISPYGYHKLQSERLIASATVSGCFNATVLRPFSVYGPLLTKQLIWDALGKLRRGAHGYAGTGNELRDWVYVDDLVTILFDVASDPVRFPALFNIGTGFGTSVAELLCTLYRLAGVEGAPTFEGGRRVGDPIALVSSAEEQAFFSNYHTTHLEDGLCSCLAWYREHTGWHE